CVIAEEAREKGGSVDDAALARLELAAAHWASGEPEKARIDLTKGRAHLGKASADEPRARTRLRVRADRLEARLAQPAQPSIPAASVIRAAESQGTAEILARAQDPEVRAEVLDLRRLQAIAKQLSAETDIDRQLPF